MCALSEELGHSHSLFNPRPAVPCGTLQDAGLMGSIPLDSCPILPALIGVCACEMGELPTEAPDTTPVPDTPAPDTPAPDTPAPVEAPGGPTPCPDIPDGGCSVCGDGLCVTSPDVIFEFPNQPPTPCGLLQQAGLDGIIPLDQCKPIHMYTFLRNSRLSFY